MRVIVRRRSARSRCDGPRRSGDDICAGLQSALARICRSYADRCFGFALIPLPKFVSALFIAGGLDRWAMRCGDLGACRSRRPGPCRNPFTARASGGAIAVASTAPRRGISLREPRSAAGEAMSRLDPIPLMKDRRTRSTIAGSRGEAHLARRALRVSRLPCWCFAILPRLRVSSPSRRRVLQAPGRDARADQCARRDSPFPPFAGCRAYGRSCITGSHAEATGQWGRGELFLIDSGAQFNGTFIHRISPARWSPVEPTGDACALHPGAQGSSPSPAPSFPGNRRWRKIDALARLPALGGRARFRPMAPGALGVGQLPLVA